MRGIFDALMISSLAWEVFVYSDMFMIIQGGLLSR